MKNLVETIIQNNPDLRERLENTPASERQKVFDDWQKEQKDPFLDDGTDDFILIKQ